MLNLTIRQLSARHLVTNINIWNNEAINIVLRATFFVNILFIYGLHLNIKLIFLCQASRMENMKKNVSVMSCLWHIKIFLEGLILIWANGQFIVTESDTLPCLDFNLWPHEFDIDIKNSKIYILFCTFIET